MADWTDEELLESIEQLRALVALRHQHIQTLLALVGSQAEDAAAEAAELERGPGRPEDPQELIERLLEARQRLQKTAEVHEKMLQDLEQLLP